MAKARTLARVHTHTHTHTHTSSLEKNKKRIKIKKKDSIKPIIKDKIRKSLLK